MNQSDNQSNSRRQFFSTSLRYLTLGGFSILVAGQEMKRRRLANDPNCIRLYTCKDCVEFNGCKLEKSVAFRASEELELKQL
ncbi:MAG TPA: hypothetical protein EYQ50_14270 [Verrucomicrobiales bacterium]|nr:hypothetical protein [Verrucomicrobiales bacterium]HIL69895.1 hypothetical protein [Verrucomicrobiota bacterium]